jgi:hypothetical protein
MFFAFSMAELPGLIRLRPTTPANPPAEIIVVHAISNNAGYRRKSLIAHSGRILL